MADPWIQRQNAAIQMQRLRMAREAEARQQFMAQQSLQARQAAEARAQQQLQLQQQQFNRGLSNDQFRNELAWRQYKAQQEDRKAQLRAKMESEARRAMDSERGKLKPGYRWKASDPREQELIPGGPEEIKLRGQHAGDLSRLQSINSATEELAKTIDYILDPKNKSGFTSNFGGWNAYITRLLPNIIPGFARTGDVSSAIDRLTELAETSGLSTVRGGSGQSVGAITEREWPKFAAQLLKLSPRLEEDTARAFLQNARTTALGIRNREMGAYENEWKPTPFYNKNPLQVPAGPSGQRTPAPQGVAQEDWDAMPDTDKALWATPQR